MISSKDPLIPMLIPSTGELKHGVRMEYKHVVEFLDNWCINSCLQKRWNPA
jgi:hypothetical protein